MHWLFWIQPFLFSWWWTLSSCFATLELTFWLKLADWLIVWIIRWTSCSNLSKWIIYIIQTSYNVEFIQLCMCILVVVHAVKGELIINTKINTNSSYLQNCWPIKSQDLEHSSKERIVASRWILQKVYHY